MKGHLPSLFTKGVPAELYKRWSLMETRRFHNELEDLKKGRSHFINIGQTGSGKGLKDSELIESALDMGIKVISIHNPTREVETAFKRYPQEGRFKRIVELQGETPRGYNVRVYCPVCKGVLPKELPPFFELFTVPVSNFPTVNAELLSAVSLVPLTDIGREAFDAILRSMKPESNIADLYLGIHQLMGKGLTDLGLWFKTVSSQSLDSLHRLLFLLHKHRLLSHSTFSHAMTNKRFVEILNNQDEISVFTQLFVPPSLQPFATSVPVSYAFDLAGRCKYPILLVATEMQKIMRNPEQLGQRLPALDSFSNRLTSLLQTGRKFNIHFLGDTQAPSSINPAFFNQAQVNSFYLEVMNAGEKDMLIRRLRDREYGSELLDVLHGLSHDPGSGLFEYYCFSQDREYAVKIPKSAHPWEGNKSDFLAYVKRKEPNLRWEDTTWVYPEIEEPIYATAKANEELIEQFAKRYSGTQALMSSFVEELGLKHKNNKEKRNTAPHFKESNERGMVSERERKEVRQWLKQHGLTIESADDDALREMAADLDFEMAELEAILATV